MRDDSVEIKLSKEEALVFFDVLSRYVESDTLLVLDEAESEVFFALLTYLERVLVEPFDSNYDEILTRAKAKLIPHA